MRTPSLLLSSAAVLGVTLPAYAQDCATTPPVTCTQGNQVDVTFGEPPTTQTSFGVPLGTQNGTWSSNSGNYRPLEIPKFVLQPGVCGTLIQADLTFEYVGRVRFRAENLDDKPQLVTASLNLTSEVFAPPALGLGQILIPNSGIVAAPVLGAFDGVQDYGGTSGFDQTSPDTVITRCFRITNPGQLAVLTGAVPGDVLQFNHQSTDQSAVVGAGNLATIVNTTAYLRVTVTYRSCVCQTSANDDTGRVCVGESVTVPVLANDTTTCGAIVPGSLAFVGTPPTGFALAGSNVVFNAAGIPAGVYVATYRVCNDQQPPCCDEGTVTVTVCETVANDDVARVCVGATVNVNVLANDSTTCGVLNPASLVFVGTPPPGFSIASGQVVYTNPGTPTSGTVQATYRVCNNLTTPCCDTATVTITICNVDAVNDTARVCAGATVTIPVLANDTTNCGVLVPGSLAFVGTPPAGFSIVGSNVVYANSGTPSSGTVQATYRVCNNENPACCDTATVTVTICNVDAVNDTARVCAGATVTIPVLNNDTTNCGALVPGSLAFVGTPPAGFSIVGSNVVYANSGTPSSGTVQATYRVCNNENPACCDTATVTVTICNVDAVNDTGRVCAGSTVSIPVLANDTTNCGALVVGSLAFVGTPPAGFSIVGSNVVYANSGTPSSGTVQATYSVCNNENPACCDTATVTVTICNVDAVNDTARVCAGASVTIPVLNNDTTNCGALVPGSLAFVGTPPAGFSIVGSNVVYANSGTPSSGTVQATYRVCNNENPACCDTATVTVTICNVTAVDDDVQACAGTTITIPVLANDTTNCGSLVVGSLAFVGTPPAGFSIAGGQIVYANPGTPNSGTVTATYRVCNDENRPCCDTAEVRVTICAVDAVDDPITICCGEVGEVNVLLNDSSTCGPLSCSDVEFLTPFPPGFSVQGCVVRYDSNLASCPPVAELRYRLRGGTGLVCLDEARVLVTVLARPVAVDDRIDLTPTTTFPLDIDVLANDSPGKGCTFPDCSGCATPSRVDPCALRITTPPQNGSVEILADCKVRYTPGPGFSNGDRFCYEVTNSCGCKDTACVTIANCREVDRATCGSLLLFPEYDNRQASMTLFTITNACCEISDGDLWVEMRFIDALTCMETDFTFRLTPCDTLTFLTSTVNPNSTRGYAYAFVKRPTAGPGNPGGMPIVRNKLIGQALIINGLENVDYSMNAVSFLGIGPELADNDDDEDGIRDLNGPFGPLPEYEQAPDEILIPRFLAQDPAGPNALFQSDLILLGLSGGRAFTTTVQFEVFNDSEDVTSQNASFYCWDKRRLVQWAPGTLYSALSFQGDDPEEILGAPNQMAGWIRLKGLIAESSLEVIRDPAIYAVLVERFGANAVADLPFEKCSQANGDLLPSGPLGDGPVPTNGDDQ
ncbi:MAG: choice-of-anchor E domain-containing protein [Planctomycetes bacterium]|nr:choice-of-anchor E domain-containing protein [Planctomycetota bacterium]